MASGGLYWPHLYNPFSLKDVELFSVTVIFRLRLRGLLPGSDHEEEARPLVQDLQEGQPDGR